MNDLLHDRLKSLFQRFGRGLLNERQRLEAELWLAAGAQTQGLHALLGAIDRRVPQALLTAPPRHRGPELEARLTQRLQTDLDYDEITARWAVEAWRDAILDAPEVGSEPVTPLPEPLARQDASSRRGVAVPSTATDESPDLTIEDVQTPLPVPSRRILLDPLRPPTSDAPRGPRSIALRDLPLTSQPPTSKRRSVGWVIAVLCLALVGVWALTVFLGEVMQPRPVMPRFEGIKVIERKKERIEDQAVLNGHQGIVTSVAVQSYDNAHLAVSGSFDQSVRVWNLEFNFQVAELRGHEGPVLCVALSPKEMLALSGGLDQKIILWNVEHRQRIRTFKGPSGVTSVAFAPNGKTFLAAYGWKEVKHNGNPDGGGSMEWRREGAVRLCPVILWDVETGKELARHYLHAEAVTCVAFLPDGQRAVSGSFDRELCVFDAKSGKEHRRFQGHKGEIFTLAVSSDGTRMLSGGGTLNPVGDKVDPEKVIEPPDTTVRLWDLQTGEVLQQFDNHRSLVLSVDLSPDGRRALTAGFEGVVHLWNVDTGQELRSWNDQAVIQSARFSPNGQRILTGGWDQVLRWRPR